MEKKSLKFLGLGSVVEVDDIDAMEDTKYFVIARAIGRNEDDSTLLRYMLAPHPFGDIPAQKDNILRITDSQIKKVIHEGYTDELDDKLLAGLERAMRDSVGKAQPLSNTVGNGTINSVDKKMSDKQIQDKQLVEQEMKKVEQEKEMLKVDPFYKFRKMKEGNANNGFN